MKFVRNSSARALGGLTGAGRLVVATVVALVLVATTGVAANAVTYTTYTTVAPIVASNGITGLQGFAAGSTWLYSISIDSNGPNGSMIRRINKDTGAVSVMQNVQKPAAPISTNPWLGHANDMALANYVDAEGTEGHMFVLTGDGSATGAQLVKLGYTGNTYKRQASYNILGLAGQNLGVDGISRVSITDTHINFLFRHDSADGLVSNIYRGSINRNAPPGTDIQLVDAFDLDFSHAVVNGVDTDLSNWARQKFIHYDPDHDTLYAAVRQGTDTIVLMFPNANSASTALRVPSAEVSFKFTASSSTSPASDNRNYTKHELEGLALSGGQLFFNTNRHTGTVAQGNIQPYDGVHRVNSYVAN